MPIYYFSSDGDSDLEVDFVVQHFGRALPIEVKAEENLRAKSLKMTVEKYKIPILFLIDIEIRSIHLLNL